MTSLTDYQASRERVEKLAAHCEEAASKHRERASEAGLGTPSTFWSDAARACENDADALRALLAGPPEPSVEEVAVSFEVWQDDDLISLSEGPLEAAWHEACHYAATYGQTGPVAVYKVTRALIIAALPPAPQPDE